MTVMTPIHAIHSDASHAWARRYPRPQEETEPETAGRIAPWRVYSALVVVSLLMWFALGEMAVLLWRLPFP
jgi:hypothetical protein